MLPQPVDARTLYDFDNAVTAPLHGFRDTDDYWTRFGQAMAATHCAAYLGTEREERSVHAGLCLAATG